MLPDLLGVPVPDAYLAGAPPVDKLTLLKSNKELREGDEQKRTASDNGVVEEEMDTQSGQKTKRKQRRKNQVENGARMEVESESTKDIEHGMDNGEKMEISQGSRRSPRRRKKEDNSIDISITNET